MEVFWCRTRLVTLVTLLVLVGAACLAGSAGAVGGSGRASGERTYLDDGGFLCSTDGSQGSQDYDVSYCTAESSEEPVYYQTVEGSWNPCRTVQYTVVGKNVFGMTLWKYRQSVFWCWNGSRTTYVYRQRYPVCCFPVWEFEGHLYNSCASENCGERRGGWTAYLATQGKFKACAFYVWACQRAYPRIWHVVRGDGSSAAGYS
jgi:hypothetical protein